MSENAEIELLLLVYLMARYAHSTQNSHGWNLGPIIPFGPLSWHKYELTASVPLKNNDAVFPSTTTPSLIRWTAQKSSSSLSPEIDKKIIIRDVIAAYAI